ncbi:MAG: YCF48-related protein [Candidatus Zixiibacteriota bacterium]
MARKLTTLGIVGLLLGLGCSNSRTVNSDQATISLSPGSLHFVANAGGANPSSQVVAVTNSGTGSLTYQVSNKASWLETQTLGSAPDTIYATAYVGSLVSGEHYDTIVVTATSKASNSPQRIPVRFTISGAIGIAPEVVKFSMSAGGPLPPAETLYITNNGGGPLDFTATESAPWLTVTPTSGSAPDTVLVGLDTTGLLSGVYGHDLVFTSAQAANSPFVVPCSLTVIGWTQQYSLHSFDFRGLTFIDELRGFVVGFIPNAPDPTGVMLGTKDGGATWNQVGPSYSGTTLGGIDFTNSTYGVAVGDSGKVLISADGGDHWEPHTFDKSWMLWKVDMLTPDTGYAVGRSGLIIKTIDGGRGWTPQNSTVTTSLADLQFFDTQEGFVVGNNAVILHTTNGGQLWEAVPSGVGASLWGVSFVDRQHGWVVGDSGRVLVTTNGGTSWTPQTSGSNIEFRSVQFVDLNYGWAVGPDGVIIHTQNGGATWQQQISGTDQWLFGVHFLNNRRGWAIGAYGTIITTFSGGR